MQESHVTQKECILTRRTGQTRAHKRVDKATGFQLMEMPSETRSMAPSLSPDPSHHDMTRKLVLQNSAILQLKLINMPHEAERARNKIALIKRLAYYVPIVTKLSREYAHSRIRRTGHQTDHFIYDCLSKLLFDTTSVARSYIEQGFYFGF
ncbi:hypothetical protein J6590_079280 [Homalodisca vitripennis]|nr:hypothetical protein J6590_079280 [Homalodisca vitripennis]